MNAQDPLVYFRKREQRATVIKRGSRRRQLYLYNRASLPIHLPCSVLQVGHQHSIAQLTQRNFALHVSFSFSCRARVILPSVDFNYTWLVNSRFIKMKLQEDVAGGISRGLRSTALPFHHASALEIIVANILKKNTRSLWIIQRTFAVVA